jgi:hypothetical protein
LENVLIETPKDDLTFVDDERHEALCIQFTAYVISAKKEKEHESFQFKMLVKGSKPPLQYWLSDGAQWLALQPICIKLFMMVISTEKLVYMKTNNAAFSDSNAWKDFGSEQSLSDEDL